MLVQDAVEVVARADLLTVYANDDVAEDDVAVLCLPERMQASRRRAAARVYVIDHHAIVDRQAHLCAVNALDVVGNDAEFRTTNHTIFEKLRHDALGYVDRNGKAYARARARRREDLRVDADHTPVRVEQRPA